MAHSPFIHLRARSAYSLLAGAIKLKQLVGLCVEHGMPAIALTDNANLFGAQEFSETATKAGVQPIIGVQITLDPFMKERSNTPSHAQEVDQVILLAKNQEGYQNLMYLMSMAYLDPAEKMPAPCVSYAQLAARSAGLIVLSGGIYGAIGRALLAGRMDDAIKALLWFKQHFADQFYLEIMRHGLPDERKTESAMLSLAQEHHVPIVATNDIYFHGGADMYEAHDALMCIADGRYVSEQNRPRLTPEHRFKTPDEMRALFADLPEALENTAIIARRCAVLSPARAPMLPPYRIEKDGEILPEAEALRITASAGLQARLEKHVFTHDMDDATKADLAKPYYERLAFELDIIIKMDYPGYFLIVSDFISWSKSQGIPVGPGRGSGAASVVAWSLLITDLDPLKYELVFERFLNPERVSMPDFDIDFCQDRRDEVIRYVQQKYGADRVAQIITFGTLQARAVLRDVGRVLQLPHGQVDRICKLVPSNPANPVTLEQALNIEPALKQAMREDEAVERMITMALKLEGLYRHASTHAAGVVIGDRPLYELVAMYRDARSDMPVVQYSMKYAEAAGLVKFDFLGLKTLTVLDRAVKFIAQRTGVVLDLLTLPQDDPATYALLTEGDTVGVFQFESAGMRDSLRKLRPDRLEDLIALGALYRPGPMDNIPRYIACKHGREEPDYMHPVLKPVLEETYGVIIYQEQVQMIARVMAGYTLGGADLLRRAMGKKIKAEMDAQRAQFAKGAAENNIPAKKASDIFDQVAKFAGYGFNKAHAAAYALIGFQTAYIKANYPVEFFAASMSLDMHNTDKLAIFRADAERLGVCVLPPDINASAADFSVEQTAHGLAVRYALGAVRNVGFDAMQELVQERKKGAFSSVADLLQRVSAKVLNKRILEHLIKSGCLDSLEPNRNTLYHSLDKLLAYNQSVTRERESVQTSLFGDVAGVELPMPALEYQQDWPPLQRLDYELAAIGFYLSSHPLEGYASALDRLRVSPYALLSERLNASEYVPITMAGIVSAKKIRQSSKGGRFAFVQLSDATGAYEAAIFNEQLLNDKRDLLEAGTAVLLTAEAKMEESGARIIIQSLRPLEDAVAGVAPKALTITLDESLLQHRGIQSLSAALPIAGDGVRATQITLHACISPQEYAVITLSITRQITPEGVLKIQSIQGIISVEG